MAKNKRYVLVEIRVDKNNEKLCHENCPGRNTYGDECWAFSANTGPVINLREDEQGNFRRCTMCLRREVELIKE
jgi:hypothetical protein